MAEFARGSVEQTELLGLRAATGTSKRRRRATMGPAVRAELKAGGPERVVGPIALAIFDTLIFVSITWSIISFTREDSTFRGTFRFYKYGGRVAQLLLSTGHLYFM